MSKHQKISLRAAAEFNTDNSKVTKLKVKKAIINEHRQEIIMTVEMDAILSFEDLEFLPINVTEVRSQMSLNIHLSTDDIKDILSNQSKEFNAELYILSKDIEIIEREYIKVKDSLSNCEMIVNMSLENEIDKRLSEMDYAIEVINPDYNNKEKYKNDN